MGQLQSNVEVAGPPVAGTVARQRVQQAVQWWGPGGQTAGTPVNLTGFGAGRQIDLPQWRLQNQTNWSIQSYCFSRTLATMATSPDNHGVRF